MTSCWSRSSLSLGADESHPSSPRADRTWAAGLLTVAGKVPPWRHGSRCSWATGAEWGRRAADGCRGSQMWRGGEEARGGEWCGRHSLSPQVLSLFTCQKFHRLAPRRSLWFAAHGALVLAAASDCRQGFLKGHAIVVPSNRKDWALRRTLRGRWIAEISRQYKRTTQRPLRRKRRELGPGFSCYMNRKLALVWRHQRWGCTLFYLQEVCDCWQPAGSNIT